jgi:hypothetical protein
MLKLILEKKDRGVVGCIYLAQDSDQWRALVNTRISSVAKELLASAEGLSSMGD